MDFSKTSTDQLKRSLKFHENDRGTMTMEQECRRMYLCQEISAELQRRGVDPWAPSRSWSCTPYAADDNLGSRRTKAQG